MNNEDIENMLRVSLENLQELYIKQENKCKDFNFSSRILFPYLRKTEKNKNGKRKIRVSEQEAVFMFTREIEKSRKYFYAVEVPTQKPYLLKDMKPRIEKAGSSGSIDVCIYDNPNTEEIDSLKCLIEFKESLQGKNIENSDKATAAKLGFVKDFLRLRYDTPTICTNYFVHIIENWREGKKKSIEDCYKNAFQYVDEYLQDYRHRQGISESIAPSEIKIFICPLKKENKEKIIEVIVKEKFDALPAA